ncbi:peroxidase family protein [Povalibacter sp.]|uniref:peroxidase family protein n=1 Tax=Povalibacter sp. TaxID=1962978 RepID=UPI002F3E3C80
MLTETQVHELANAMMNSLGPGLSIDAGYTYLGQFIAHELLPETHPREERLTIPRMVTGRMDLESLYGGPSSRPLARGVFNSHYIGAPQDLERNDFTGVALIPERRNDENVVIAQLHRFLQRLHDTIVARKYGDTEEKARRLLTLLFQLIVVEDYLRQILEPRVFQSCFRRHERWLGFSPNTTPPEFSHACFRFGHSMVRNKYRGFPNEHGKMVTIGELFRTGQRLDPKFLVDWREFFGWPNPGEATQKAFPIDPFVVDAMSAVGPPQLCADDATATDKRTSVNVVEINLIAGIEAKLPPGIVYALSLLTAPNCADLVKTVGYVPVRELWPAFAKALAVRAPTVDIDNLPLWPYILNEAAVTQNCQRLGTLGSLICAEAIANAIASAHYSILRIEPYSIDTVLNSLGALGQELRTIQRDHEHLSTDGRTLSMRHLIEFVL